MAIPAYRYLSQKTSASAEAGHVFKYSCFQMSDRQSRPIAAVSRDEALLCGQHGSCVPKAFRSIPYV